MTDDQIERAARVLCRMRGLDPDKHVCRELPHGGVGNWHGPQWLVYEDEVRAALQIQEAIKEAASEPAGATEPNQGFVTAEEKRLRLDLQKAEELLGWAARFMRSTGAFGIAADNRDELVARIRRFLDRKGA